MEPETLFRKQLHLMLEPRPRRYHIEKGADAWGLVVTRPVMPGVQVWYAREKGLLTLALTTAYTQKLIPKDAIPPGASPEISDTGWRMFRWPAPVLSYEEPPESQPEVARLIELIKAAFDWFNATRTDKN